MNIMLIIAQYELTSENSHNNAVIGGIKGQLHEIPSFSIKAAAEFLPQSPEEQTKLADNPATSRESSDVTTICTK